MENKEKEYVSIVIITLLHGIYTYCELGKIPYIALGIVNKITINAFLLWMIYSMCLYLIVQKWIIQEEKMVKHFVLSVVFGIVGAFTKGIIDFTVEKISNYLQSVIKLACIDEASTAIFYILLTYVLLVVIGKRKIHLKGRNIKVQLCMLMVCLLSYVVFVCNYLWQKQSAIEMYNATEEEIFNLDYYFGMKIIDGNVWFYMVFFIVFWWFMRRLTAEEKYGVIVDE